MRNYCAKYLAQTERRRAVVTVMVLVVLLLMSAMIVEFVRRAVTDRRQMRQEHSYQQTLQLADAGVRKMRQKLSADPSYTGETWDVAAGTVHAPNTASVQISVDGSTATITARYPSNVKIPLKVTRTVRLSP